MLKESDVSSERMHFLIERGRCSCGGPLSIAWGGAFGFAGFILRCGKNIDHKDFEVPYEINPYSDPDMPGWRMSRERRMALEAKVGPEKKQALMKYEGVTSLTKEDARIIITKMWPNAEKASPIEFFKAMTICHQYGLNPVAGHLYLIPFDKKDKQGNIIATTYTAIKSIGASRLIARRRHSYSYIDLTPRYMTEEEEKKVWKTVDPNMVRTIVTLKDTKTGATASGYGQWAKTKTIGGKQYPNNPKGIDMGNSMENMSGIRGERQALDRLYPADMPPPNIPFEDEFAEGQSVVVEKVSGEPEKPPVIDDETGEILDGEFSQVEEIVGEVTTELGTGAPPAAKPPVEQPPPAAEKAKTPAPGKGPIVQEKEQESLRHFNIRMVRSGASKLGWDNKRLMEELHKTAPDAKSLEELMDDELQTFASKITDLVECA